MRAYVGVGTNLGDRWQYLALAARALRSTPGVAVTRLSRVYDTRALDDRQPRYLNAVIELETSLQAEQLLSVLLGVEQTAHRRRDVRWGPRTLDLDLLLYEDRVFRTPTLSVPHPGLLSRRFVLGPLAELCPDRVVPGTGSTVADLLRTVPPYDMSCAGLYPA
jgi:2-amino-4-hydroxy-6-hydroxymethyldihydropteridine diphosphokinase